MSKQIAELESILQQQIVEHKKMLNLIETHYAAMKKADLRKMEDFGHLGEACRLRIATLEHKRKTLTLQIAKAMKQTGDLKITQIAELFPASKLSLLKLR